MQVETFFKNPFEDRNITDERLDTFADDAKANLVAEVNTEFDALIAEITTNTEGLKGEVGEVRSTTAVQKGKTKTVDAIIKDFKVYMSDNEGVIAKAVGGKRSATFLEFYPQGVSQYTTVTKTNIEGILKQVWNAANTNKTAIGKDTEKELKDFTTQYTTARDAQVKQKGKVNDNKTEKKDYRKLLGITLLKTMHKVGYVYAGDTAKCSSFFNFSLLYAATKTKKVKPTEEVKS